MQNNDNIKDIYKCGSGEGGATESTWQCDAFFLGQES